jgi:hypothetical protein
MSIIDETVLQSFREGLRKEAVSQTAATMFEHAVPRLRNVGSLGGIGALGGALTGAAAGGARHYHEAREQGASVGGSLLGGLGGAVSGAAKGGLIGAGLGAGAGALAKGDLSRLGDRSGLVGAGARFGQRQVHSLTGNLSPQELIGVRGGAYGAQQSLRRAAQGVASATTPKAFEKAHSVEQRAAKALRATADATGLRTNMDLTSLPGYAKAVKEHGVGKVLATGAREQIANSPPALAALMIGAPVVGAGKALLGPDEVDAQGRGRGERVGEELGRAVGGVAGGVMPVVGQGVVGGVLGKAGKLVGRGVDKLRPHLSTPGMTPRTLEPSEGQHTPSERVMSPNAAGQAPEIGI